MPLDPLQIGAEAVLEGRSGWVLLCLFAWLPIGPAVSEQCIYELVVFWVG